MGFSDVSYAARMRDLITQVAASVVDTMRPEPRLGKVYSFSISSMTAQILFAGEGIDNLVPVKFSPLMTPVTQMADTYATNGLDAKGDIVRVAGRAGGLYISDFVSGGPSIAGAGFQVGDIKPWPTVIPPANWLSMDGSFVNQADWPALFALISHSANGGVDPGDGTFKLPLGTDRVLMGFSASKPILATGGAETVTLVANQLPTHTHDISHGHNNTNNTGAHTHTPADMRTTGGQGTQSRAMAGSGTGALVTPIATDSNGDHAHSVPDFNGASGNGSFANNPVDIKPQFLAVNYIIKAA